MRRVSQMRLIAVVVVGRLGLGAAWPPTHQRQEHEFQQQSTERRKHTRVKRALVELVIAVSNISHDSLRRVSGSMEKTEAIRQLTLLRPQALAAQRASTGATTLSQQVQWMSSSTGFRVDRPREADGLS